MDEQQQLEAIAEQIGQAAMAEIMRRNENKFTAAERMAVEIAVRKARTPLAQLIGENAKLKKLVAENAKLRKLVAERSPGGYADAPVADEYAWTERDQTQHDIRMTDDPIYAKWFRKREKDRDAMENGINED